MKTFRSLIYVIIAMFLGIFINLLSLTFVMKNVVQDEIVTNTIKVSVVGGYLTKNINGLTEEQKNTLENFLNDSEMNDVVNVLIEDYLNYLSDPNYKITQNDVDKLKDYIVKHQDLIKQISNEDVDINEITKEITVDNIDNGIKEVYDNLSDMPSQVKPVINTYKYITVGPLKIILIGLIVLYIGLLMLISWSFIKWMKATGICLITNGVLVLLMFVFIDGIKDLIIKAMDIGIKLGNITFNNILIMGIIELVLGIALVVTHSLLSKKFISSDKSEKNEQQEHIDNVNTNEETVTIQDNKVD